MIHDQRFYEVPSKFNFAFGIKSRLSETYTGSSNWARSYLNLRENSQFFAVLHGTEII